MKLGKIVCCLLCVVGLNSITGIVQADYQHDVTYRDESADYDNNVDYSFTEISYTYYIAPVISNEQPLAEAAYLQRVSSIQVGLSEFDIGYPQSSLKAGGDGTGVGYIMLDPASPFKLEATYQTYSADYTLGGEYFYDVDVTEYGISLGWFMDQAMSFDINVLKTKVEYDPFSYANYETTDIFMTAKNVRTLGGGKALNLEGLLGRNDHRDGTNTVYGVAADYYLTNKLGVGGTYIIESGNDEEYEGKTTGVHARLFITPEVSLGLELSSFDADNAAGDSYDETELELSFRF